MTPDTTTTTASNRAEALRSDAIVRTEGWRPLKQRGHRPSSDLVRLFRDTSNSIRDAINRLRLSVSGSGIPAAPARLILENNRVLLTAIRESGDAVRAARRLPHVRSCTDHVRPRAYEVAAAYLEATDYTFEEEHLLMYLQGAQSKHDLAMKEIWALQPMLQFALLTAVAKYIREPSEEDQLSNLMLALVKIGETDWQRLFERVSVIERILREDPLRAYAEMDFESRDLYRKAVAELAEGADVDEAQVAKDAVALAHQSWVLGLPDARRADRVRHVGYYLIDKGVSALKRRIGYRTPVKRMLRSVALSYPTAFYMVGVELTTFVTVAFLLGGLNTLTPILAGLLLLLLPATQAAVEFINQITTLIVPPRRLARLDFSKGIPDDCATLVAVPTLLLNEEQVRESVETLEIRYLANRDPNLHFALLTDSPDSPQPLEEDDNLVHLASRLIQELNRKYGSIGGSQFFLFHRERLFNPAEDVWMGWERKRGKLLDLNNLLRNRADSFPVKIGDLSVLPQIRYVITLDSDTQLPKDSARKLIGAIAHPLNRAIINPVTNTVVAGYGILQPRVGVSVRSATRSRLARIYSGQTGFDIYTRAVSDVYQDLFGEGSFTGKGIYEVDTLIQVLAERFPTNALLSHDLIEGAYARSALASDIEVIDDYPSHFRAYSKRKHRWVRGDWQVIFWLFPKVPDFFGRRVLNPLNVISRWKILDNLRRSLIEIATVCLLLAGWFLLPGGPLYWTLVITLLLLIPVYSQFVFTLLRIGSAPKVSSFFLEALAAFVTGHGNVLLTLIFLPYQALIMLDAIVRTVIRRTITRKKLLEWETAAQAEAATRKTPVDIYLDITPWLVVLIWAALSVARPHALAAALPLVLLWASSKAFSLWLNRPPRRENNTVPEKDREALREIGLRTWQFFREFSGPAENYLIPDNVQEEPAAIAHRISPTNMGFLLNARLAAYDLGFETLQEFVNATGETLNVLERLPRYRGHFFNWYDTQTFAPLDPRFVSTVDSGNLAACLWTLKQGCLELCSEPEAAERLQELAARASALVDEMDFGLLYNSERKLLSVGYNVGEGRLEASCYDLLASEARMANFVAVAKNDIPQESWFHLGRAHLRYHGQRILLSWTGTMFEYMLPSLWMKLYPDTILDQSLRAAVECQKRYARKKRVPWGISEAAYAITDQAGSYQYKAFGVPELALKYGVSGAVIAPYSAALGLMVDAKASMKNLKMMDGLGWTGKFGFYDSTDFSEPEKPVIVRTWMAHHQGMILLSIANSLVGSPMQRRFHAEPLVKANELILHEKMPFSVAVESAESLELVAGSSWQPALVKLR